MGTKTEDAEFFNRVQIIVIIEHSRSALRFVADMYMSSLLFWGFLHSLQFLAAMQSTRHSCGHTEMNGHFVHSGY